MSYDEDGGEDGGASPTYDYADDGALDRQQEGEQQTGADGAIQLYSDATASALVEPAAAAATSVSPAVPSAGGTAPSPIHQPRPSAFAASNTTPRNPAATFHSPSAGPPPTATASQSHRDPGCANKAAAWPIRFSQSTPQSNKKNSKRKSAPSSQQSLFGLSQSGSGSQLGEGGSRFVECPACQRSMPHFDLDEHLDRGCGRDEQVHSGAKKRKAPEATPASVDKPRPTVLSKRVEQLVASQNSGSSFGECPACGENVVLATINHHLDIECRMRANQRPRASHALASQKGDAASSHGVSATAATPALAVPSTATVAAPSAAPLPVAVAAAAAPAASSPLAPSAPAGPPAQLASIQPVAASIPVVGIVAAASTEPNAETLLISQTEPAVLLESPAAPVVAPTQPTETAQTNGSRSLSPNASEADPSANGASGSSPHPFFTSGPRAASAFLPPRRHRFDTVKCDSIVHFTAVRCDAALASSLSPGAVAPTDSGIACEWQDCPDPNNAGYLPTLCATAPFHSNTKCHEPGQGEAGDVWTDVHIHAARSFLHDSPPIDLAAPTLPHNQRNGRRFNLSLSQLKSLLQKNVRLSRPAAAVRCALQLMNFSLIEFLRRFSVIMLEDAILHPQLPFVVWMTLALGKKNAFVPTHNHVDRLLQMVHEVAGVGVKDALLPEEGAAENMPPQADDTEEDGVDGEGGESESVIAAAAGVATSGRVSTSASSLPPPTLGDPLSGLSPPQLLLVKSILARACMGGSAWDVRMLRSYAHLWSKRFHAENQHRARMGVEGAQAAVPPSPASAALMSPASGSWLSFLDALYSPAMCPVPVKLRLTGPISVLSLGYFADDDLVLSAIDFHCSDIMDRLLNNNGRTRSVIESKCEQTHGTGKCSSCADVLKSLMWRYRSSLTNKHALRSGTDPHDAPDPAAERMFQAIKADIDQAAKRIIAGRIQFV